MRELRLRKMKGSKFSERRVKLRLSESKTQCFKRFVLLTVSLSTH